MENCQKYCKHNIRRRTKPKTVKKTKKNSRQFLYKFICVWNIKNFGHHNQISTQRSKTSIETQQQQYFIN